MVKRAPLDLPAGIARSFVADMEAYFGEHGAHKRDEIAARQLHALRQHQGPREKKLRLSDVQEMFEQMRQHLDEAQNQKRAPPPKKGKRG